MAGQSILLVDDTVISLKLTSILLANLGYRVLTAGSAEEAWDILRANHPRLVLTDIELPGMSGLQLARRIKTSAETRGIPVIALSAFADSEEEAEALRAGCDGCMRKPVDAPALASCLRRFLKDSPADPPETPPATTPLSDQALQPLRARFLHETLAHARRWKMDLEVEFRSEEAAREVHQWIGAAGLLGLPEISEKAQTLNAVLRTPPIDLAEVREALDSVSLALAARLESPKP